MKSSERNLITMADTQLSDEALAEIAERPSVSTEQWCLHRVLLTESERDALVQTVRALRAERLEIQRALASAVLEDPAEDDNPSYSSTELVEGVRWLLQMKEAKQVRTIALRKQLGQAQSDVRTQRETIKFWQRHIERMGKLLGTVAMDLEVEQAVKQLQSRLAQVERERDGLRSALKPFAALDIEAFSHLRDKSDDREIYKMNDTVITAGDVRNARAQLKATEQP